MRNIAEIIEDDKNGKQLSQTEKQIAVAYVQGKYDAVRELKIANNSNTNHVLDKIKAEIEQLPTNYIEIQRHHSTVERDVVELCTVMRIIDKYKAGSEEK